MILRIVALLALSIGVVYCANNLLPVNRSITVQDCTPRPLAAKCPPKKVLLLFKFELVIRPYMYDSRIQKREKVAFNYVENLKQVCNGKNECSIPPIIVPKDDDRTFCMITFLFSFKCLLPDKNDLRKASASDDQLVNNGQNTNKTAAAKNVLNHALDGIFNNEMIRSGVAADESDILTRLDVNRNILQKISGDIGRIISSDVRQSFKDMNGEIRGEIARIERKLSSIKARDVNNIDVVNNINGGDKKRSATEAAAAVCAKPNKEVVELHNHLLLTITLLVVLSAFIVGLMTILVCIFWRQKKVARSRARVSVRHAENNNYERAYMNAIMKMQMLQAYNQSGKLVRTDTNRDSKTESKQNSLLDDGEYSQINKDQISHTSHT